MRLLLAAVIGVTIGAIVTPMLVAEGALHIVHRPRPESAYANAIAWSAASVWEPARVVAADGTALDAWLFTPRHANGSAVILLHGVGDTRAGMLTHAGYLLRAGYIVLTPDSRGHGSSGGSLITYGVREASDVRTWAGWLLSERPIRHLYGLGQSMGAAILLQSLPAESRFRAVVAECPFDTFEDVASYRLQHASGLGQWAAWPTVQIGIFYARVAYGIDLRKASPASAIRSTTTPILLIHGDGDVNIPAVQSMALQSANPRAATLWLVPGAGHVAAIRVRPEEYVRRVTAWFQSHP